MPVTIETPKKGKLAQAATKAKSVAEETVAKEPTELSDAELADELGMHRAILEEAFKDRRERVKALESEAKARAELAPSDEKVALKGVDYVIRFSAARRVRKVKDIAGVLLSIGEEAFLSICNIPIRKLDGVLSEDEQKSKGLIEYEAMGRTMKVEDR